MTDALRPRSTAELSALLRGAPGRVRLRGTGSRHDRLPAVATATPVHLDGLDRIERLDAADQTCSVGAGLRRELLDEALAKVGLQLPCAGGGSVGGLFASDDTGVVGQAPRTLLLGLEGVLACGTVFRSGARVVKSVAGFDVHKLLPGSRGQLFAATTLHLRLRPLPRTTAWFRRRAADAADALRLFQELRRLPVPPAALQFRSGETAVVAGCFAGRASFVTAALRTHGLDEGPPVNDLHLPATGAGEVLAGIVPASAALALLAAAPPGSPFLLHGGGRFEIALPSAAASDALLDRLPALGGHAWIALGAAERRGRSTPLDPGQQRLCAGLKHALDPHGIFV